MSGPIRARPRGSRSGAQPGPPGIAITEAVSGRRVDLHLTGELDAWSSDKLDDYLRRHEECGVSEIRIDLGGLAFIDAAGVGTLVSAARRAGSGGWRLSLANARGLVARVIKLTQLEEMIDHWQDPAGAEPAVTESRKRLAEAIKPGAERQSKNSSAVSTNGEGP